MADTDEVREEQEGAATAQADGDQGRDEQKTDDAPAGETVSE